MTTIIYVCILVVWLNLVLPYGANGQIPAVSYDDQQVSDNIIIKLKPSGTTDDIKNILNNHPRFKLRRSFDLLGVTYVKLVSDKDNEQKAALKEDKDIISIKNDPKVDSVVYDYMYSVEPRALNGNPELDIAWYTTRQRDVKVSMNIDKAWKKGYSGKNVVVSVIDTQVQIDHDDLGNFDAENSSFIVQQTNQEMEDNNVITGTALAGVIAATKDNGICITGVAYNAKVQAVGIIPPGDRTINKVLAVLALGQNVPTVDIYTARLGSASNKGFDGIIGTVNNALKLIIPSGRNGKGGIYVFGAGDEGPTANAAVDEFGYSIYAIAISSVEYASVAKYGEIGSNIMAVGYGGSHKHKLINYIYPDNKCSNISDGIYGTSFAAAQVSGIIALALEANPDLTWRDVQHLIVRSSRRHHFKDNYYPKYKWKRNSAGFFFHPKMGFGLVDALKMVNLAKRWKTAPNMTTCSFTKSLSETVRDGKYLTGNVKVVRNNCAIRFIENVQVVISQVGYSKLRGYTEIDLISPRGTVSPILTERPDDNADTLTSGNIVYGFRSVHFWGENTLGNWKLRARSLSKFVEVGPLQWQVLFYGTTRNPRT